MEANNELSRSDHDLLIRVDQKLSQVSLDIKDVKDGLNSRVAILEAKTIGYDQILVEYPPAKHIEMLIKHEKWINDFKLTWKVIVGMTITLSSIITFLLTIIGQFVIKK